MPGFFIRPKSSTKSSATGQTYVEEIQVVSAYEQEYTSGSGVAQHYRDPERREAEPGYSLPTGGRSKGISGGVRSWNGPVSKSVPSGFGRGRR